MPLQSLSPVNGLLGRSQQTLWGSCQHLSTNTCFIAKWYWVLEVWARDPINKLSDCRLGWVSLSQFLCVTLVLQWFLSCGGTSLFSTGAPVTSGIVATSSEEVRCRNRIDESARIYRVSATYQVSPNVSVPGPFLTLTSIEHHRASSSMSIIEHHRASVATFKTLASACIRPTNSLRSLGSTIWSFYSHIPRISKLEACLQWAKQWRCLGEIAHANWVHCLPPTLNVLACLDAVGQWKQRLAHCRALNKEGTFRVVRALYIFVHTQDIFKIFSPQFYPCLTVCLACLSFSTCRGTWTIGPKISLCKTRVCRC